MRAAPPASSSCSPGLRMRYSTHCGLPGQSAPSAAQASQRAAPAAHPNGGSIREDKPKHFLPPLREEGRAENKALLFPQLPCRREKPAPIGGHAQSANGRDADKVQVSQHRPISASDGTALSVAFTRPRLATSRGRGCPHRSPRSIPAGYHRIAAAQDRSAYVGPAGICARGPGHPTR